MSSNNPS